MIGLVLLARTAISMRLVGWAAILVLVLAPERLLGASFQMSFAAVIALVAVYEVVRGHVHFGGIEAGWPRRPAFYISCVALTTVLATLATAPFAAYCFNRLALYGLAANIVAVPITALWIMPWGIVALALMPFGAEALGLAPMGLGIEAVIAVARKVAGWPDVVALAPAIPIGALALIVAGGLWLTLWRGRWRLLGLVAVFIGFASAGAISPPDVVIDASGRLMAVRGPGGALVLSSDRVMKFEGAYWLRRAGQEKTEQWPRESLGPGGLVACDGLGCIYRALGRTIALVNRPHALAEDCRRADMIVSAVPVRGRCPATHSVIARFEL